MSELRLSVHHLSKQFSSKTREIKAVRDVSFHLYASETLGITGPSGCGKSTLAKCILRLIEPDEGKILIAGMDWQRLKGRALRQARRDIQIIFQNSTDSFSRFATVQSTINDPLRIHQIVPSNERQHEITRLLKLVGLGDELLHRRMNSLSGGQRQRVAIARAISTRPKVLILDEAVSALDQLAKRQILELIVSLQKETGLACLFISHDFAAIHAVCHRVAVMDAGEIVEIGRTQDVIGNPRHARTRALIDAVLAL